MCELPAFAIPIDREATEGRSEKKDARCQTRDKSTRDTRRETQGRGHRVSP